MLQIVIAGIARCIGRMLAAIQLGNMVHGGTQRTDSCIGKEIEKDGLKRFGNRNGVGYIDGVGDIKVISTEFWIAALHCNMLSRS